jgi:hypothetical protein
MVIVEPEDKFEDRVQALARELCRRIDVDEKFWRQYAGQIRERLIADAVTEVIGTSNLPLLNESKH